MIFSLKIKLNCSNAEPKYYSSCLKHIMSAIIDGAELVHSQ